MRPNLFCPRLVRSTHTKPVRVLDALTGHPARFRIFVHAEPSDNPMQSELSGHIGGKGNLSCRKCNVGGTKAEKESNEGFHALFSVRTYQLLRLHACSYFTSNNNPHNKPGKPRSGRNTLDEIKSQVKTACLGVASHVQNRQTDHGIKDTYTQYWIEDLICRARLAKRQNPSRSDADIQTELMAWVETNAAKIYNPFLTLQGLSLSVFYRVTVLISALICFVGLDPALDTPIEILHTVLLGVVKYTWHWSHTTWTDAQKSIYSRRLQGTNINHLATLPIRANYIMQYANSLIGRQLKTVAQATAFHVYDTLPILKYELWLAVGDMTALFWFPEIRDMKVYKVYISLMQ